MRPFLYKEGVKPKKNRPVYVGFLLTDVTRLGLLDTKTPKKGSLPFFFKLNNTEVKTDTRVFKLP